MEKIFHHLLCLANIAEILDDQSFLMPALLKRLIVLSTFVMLAYKKIFVIAIEEQIIIAKCVILFLPSLDKMSYVINQDLRITRYLN